MTEVALSLPSGAIWSALPVPALLIARRAGIEVVEACNPAGEDFLAASATHLRGMAVFDVLTLDASTEDAMARARTNRATVYINDVGLTTAAQGAILCDLQLAPMNDPDETVLLLISSREFAGRLGGRRRVNAAAKSAIGLSQMLAHEIKNPLAGISGAAQLLSMGLAPEEQQFTDLIVAETRRIVTLLDQVEAFGDQRPPAREPVNIHDVLERARQSAALGFGAHMRFEKVYDPSLPNVLADPDQILQVILNLVKNASEAQPDGGTIRLRSFFERGLQVQGAQGQRVALPLHVEVIDDGPGLPPTIADNVFEPFVSGRENGTGLGLALVSKIVAAHDGWIEVRSRPGQTVFRLSLPIAPPHKPVSDSPRRKAL